MKFYGIYTHTTYEIFVFVKKNLKNNLPDSFFFLMSFNFFEATFSKIKGLLCAFENHLMK